MNDDHFKRLAAAWHKAHLRSELEDVGGHMALTLENMACVGEAEARDACTQDAYTIAVFKGSDVPVGTKLYIVKENS